MPVLVRPRPQPLGCPTGQGVRDHAVPWKHHRVLRRRGSPPRISGRLQLAPCDRQPVAVAVREPAVQRAALLQPHRRHRREGRRPCRPDDDGGEDQPDGQRQRRAAGSAARRGRAALGRGAARRGEPVLPATRRLAQSLPDVIPARAVDGGVFQQDAVACCWRRHLDRGPGAQQPRRRRRHRDRALGPVDAVGPESQPISRPAL